ncbi:SANT domain DNA binding protein [Lasiodiplodia theobromae]|uniref:DNA-binding protein REB1 n=1 Tax=Lasiodiplodia theobromae TaxID=45133 RepID=A0A5N5D9P0_9PEZI|nr:SANT domain DNA binding protein [Lasiodiplodia theobromae]KAB2574110.1 DNA-binding protein REB1 [Lasiodiplodia theobromae]KAF4536674.1 SANT domain DNA binding protein [Lasiodiplodia theobromae]
MGNTSSQVQDEAPDASQRSGPLDPSTNRNEDDAAASSQLVSEVHTAAVPTFEKEGKEKKSKKNKKRKSLEATSDAHTDEQGTSAPQADEDAPGAGNAAAADPKESSSAVQNAKSQADEQPPRESRRKRKDKNAVPADAPATTDDTVESTKAEPAEGDKAAHKKRKRRSEGTASHATTDTPQPAAAAQADPTPAEDGQSAEDLSRKKQKKSTRSAAAPAQVKNTPIPIPTFNPPVTRQQESIPIRKSKRKADAAEAAKNVRAEKSPVQAAPVKDKRSNTADGQAPKNTEKKQRKSRKAQQDAAVASANREFPPQPSMNSVELSVIDPALLPPAQQQTSVEPPAQNTLEETSGRKKSRKSAKSQADATTPMAQGIAVADALLETQAPGAANGVNGNAHGTEVTGEKAYIDHQKKKQKRKRQGDEAAAAQTAQQPDSAEPKSKKRKKASEKDAGTKGGSAAASAKGAKPQGTEDFPSSGPYTKKEVETLTRAIEAYREYNDLSQAQVNDIVQAGVFNEVHSKSCKEFWDEICPCLPNRWSRETIIKFVRRKWHNFDKRGKWDPEEDQMLRMAYAKTPGQWTKIGEAVGRFADDCRDRWRNYLSCSETMASKRWHDSEVNELLNVVQDCLNTLLERLPEDKKNYWREELQSTEQRGIWRPDEIRNLVRKMPDCMDALRTAFEEKHPRESKQKRATEKRRGSSATDGSVVINWDLVSEKMGKKRSRLQIMSKWKALEHSYSQDPKETFFTEANHWRVENGQKWAEQMLPGDKYNIVRAMMDLGLTNEERIIWNSVAHHELVKLKWAHQAKMTFLSMKELVPPQESLPQLLQSLKDYFEFNHGSELDSHWRYEGRPGRGSLKSVTKSPGPLDWRGHMRGESSYKSSARVTDDDEDGME